MLILRYFNWHSVLHILSDRNSIMLVVTGLLWGLFFRSVILIVVTDFEFEEIKWKIRRSNASQQIWDKVAVCLVQQFVLHVSPVSKRAEKYVKEEVTVQEKWNQKSSGVQVHHQPHPLPRPLFSFFKHSHTDSLLQPNCMRNFEVNSCVKLLVQVL